MKYEAPPLPYAYDSLEPYIDAQTMEIHYTKHHQAYTNNLNIILEKYPTIADEKLEDLIKIDELMGKLPNLAMDEKDKKTLKNNCGGYLNHTLFWNTMSPRKQIDLALADEITKEFGSVEEFKKLFTQIAATHFASGWAWLVRDEAGKLQIYSLPDQDSPLSLGHTPIFCLDVWEHAYYLKYQNRRPEYIENWWNVLKLL